MRSSSNKLPLAVLGLLLAGCAGSTPPLPPDTTSVNRTRSVTLADFSPEDQAMSCTSIAAERDKIAADLRAANARIEGNRARDQTALYFGGVLAAPFIANTNDPERAAVSDLYRRQDTLIKLAAVKACPAAAT